MFLSLIHLNFLKTPTLNEDASELELNYEKGIWGDERRIRGHVKIPDSEKFKLSSLLKLRTRYSGPRLGRRKIL